MDCKQQEGILTNFFLIHEIADGRTPLPLTTITPLTLFSGQDDFLNGSSGSEWN
jgi:hypothetical protein